MASQYAALLPAGPAPTTTTSACTSRSASCGDVLACASAAGADMHALLIIEGLPSL